MKYSAIAITAILFTALACRSGDSGPAIYGSFFVRYMESGRQLKANASFFEGDTLATARPKVWDGGVAFLGSAMDVRDLAGTELRYVAERQIDFLEEYAFRFSDDRGKIQELKAVVNRIDNLAFKAPASKQSGLIFTHGGPPLEKGENLILLISVPSGQTRTISLNGPQPGNEIILPADDAALLPAGKLQWYAVRRKKLEFKEGRFDYAVETEYYTAQTEVEVMP